MKTPTKSRPLLQSEAMEEFEIQTRDLLIREMKTRQVTYGELSARLEALGLHETPDRLNRKVNRQKFSAAFLMACLKALEVPAVDVQALDISPDGRAARLERERIAAIYLEGRRRKKTPPTGGSATR